MNLAQKEKMMKQVFQTIAIAIEKIYLETLKDNYYEKSFTVYYELLRKEKHYASS